MSHYSALFAQRRLRSQNQTPVWEQDAPTIRIPCVTGVHTVQEMPGGYMDCDFVIPQQHARYDPADFQRNTQAWLFDGLSSMFHGYVAKAIPNKDGGINITCEGGWKKLGDTCMRIVWSDGDIGNPNIAPGSARSANVSNNSYGNLDLSFPKDHQFKAGTFVAVDFFLFGEAAGPRDGKLIDGWDITIGSNSSFPNAPALEGRVYGLTGPGDDTPNLLQVFNSAGVSVQQTSDASFGDNIHPWPAPGGGYRCIRVGLYAASDTGTFANDQTMIIAECRITTRGRTLGLTSERQTSTLVKDMFADAANSFDTHHLLQEESIPSTNEAVVGNIRPSGSLVSNIAFNDWTPPSEIVESFAAIDGSYVGMWGPAGRIPNGAQVARTTTRQWWYRQPPELVYRDWASLNRPDYIIRLLRGAVWEPDDQEDGNVSATYVNYTTLKDRQLSVFVEDSSQDNYLYEQGWHEAAEWTIDPPVKSSTAASLAERYNNLRRQPVLSGTITISGDRPGAIEGNWGARLLKLSQIRPGVVRIVDAKGPVAGRITRVEYTSRQGGQPEQVVLALNSPAAAKLDRSLATLARRAEHRRAR